jgi:hypothetical protein
MLDVRLWFVVASYAFAKMILQWGDKDKENCLNNREDLELK